MPAAPLAWRWTYHPVFVSFAHFYYLLSIFAALVAARHNNARDSIYQKENSRMAKTEKIEIRCNLHGTKGAAIATSRAAGLGVPECVKCDCGGEIKLWHGLSSLSMCKCGRTFWNDAIFTVKTSDGQVINDILGDLTKPQAITLVPPDGYRFVAGKSTHTIHTIPVGHDESYRNSIYDVLLRWDSANLKISRISKCGGRLLISVRACKQVTKLGPLPIFGMIVYAGRLYLEGYIAKPGVKPRLRLDAKVLVDGHTKTSRKFVITADKKILDTNGRRVDINNADQVIEAVGKVLRKDL